MEVSVGRMDAHDGLVGFGDGQGDFVLEGANETGFIVQQDAKALVRLCHQASGEELFVASQNRGPLKIFKGERNGQFIDLKKGDIAAIITLKNGQTRKQEFYYGAGFLSQSSRSLRLDNTIDKVTVINTKGEKRVIATSELSMR